MSVRKKDRWVAEVFRRSFGRRYDAMVEDFDGYWYWEVGAIDGAKLGSGHKPDEKAAKLACRRLVESLEAKAGAR